MFENRHHNIILDFNGDGDERWEVYPLSPESESVFNYQMIRRYVNSCNGLVFFFDENDGEAYICNPASNHSRAIPLPSIVDFPPPGFDSCWGCSALGFDSRSNDYKFIIYVDHFFANSLATYVFLYSLKTDSWKSRTGFPSAVVFTDPCVYADGSIYWIKPAFTPYFSIDSFDFSDEAFSSFDTSFQTDSYQVRLVAGSHDQLGLIAYKINSPYCFEIWVKTSAHAWNFDKLWSFSLPQILPHRYPLHDLFILGFSGGVLYLAAAKGEVFAYDCAANRLDNLQIRLRRYRDIDPVFISYVETTVSPSRSD